MKQSERKVLVCIFAHPDDEAFGPGGTIAKLAKTEDVYVICATRGEAGMNHRADKNVRLAAIREEELLESAKILGVKKVYFLNYQDGTLSNSLYHKIASDIEAHLNTLRPETILTFEPRGVSGHIDHVAMSMVSSYVFEKLPFIKKILYYCISDKLRARHKKYFIYFPPGYKKSEVGRVENVASEWSTKLKAMYKHESQIKDVKRILDRHRGLPKEEYFLVRNK